MMFVLPTLLVSLAVSAGDNTVLLDFYSDNCGPCREMHPVVQQLAAQGWPVRQVNCDREPQLAQQHRVRQIPCFVMLVDGREVDRHVGRTSGQRLVQMLALGRATGKAPPVQNVGGAKAPGSVIIPAVPSGPAFGDTAGPAGERILETPRTPPASGWRITPPEAAEAGAAVSEAELISMSARIRVITAGGQSCGSGTFIDARQDEALLLTCAHLFREAKDQGRIEVDTFGDGAMERLPGTLLHYDLDRDVALIAVRPPRPVRAARVAPAGLRLAKGAKIYSVGCNGGANPTVRQGVITALDRFLGPPNITASGLPVEGRSGGGLFTADGQVIGVCNAALQDENCGFYAALGSIHAELDAAKLGFVVADDARPAPVEMAGGPPSMPKRMPAPGEMRKETGDHMPAPARDVAPAAAPAPREQPPTVPAGPRVELKPGERAALDEIQRRMAEGAEVICVIRPKNDPQAKSEILRLQNPSTEFLDRLVAPAAHTSNSNADPDWSPRWLQRGYRGE